MKVIALIYMKHVPGVNVILLMHAFPCYISLTLKRRKYILLYSFFLYFCSLCPFIHEETLMYLQTLLPLMFLQT